MPDNNAQNDTLEILFQRRNKSYGAYMLRRSYFRHLSMALGLGLVIIFTLLYMPDILGSIGFKRKARPRLLPPVELPRLPPIDVRKLQPEKKLPPKPPSTAKAKPASNASKSTSGGASTEVQPDDFADPNKSPDKQPGKDSTDLAKEKTEPKKDPPSDTSGQAATKPPVKPDEQPKQEEFEVVVQQLPGYVGGDADLWKYVYANLDYPQAARDLGLEGTVIVEFIVNKDGKISNAKCVQDIGGGCGDSAVRLVRKMPAWIPGVYDKKPVKFKLRMPIEFRLDK